jgi:hypothetical protein
MILYYAFGGGFGHLSRTSALIHTLKLPLDDVLVLTNSKYAHIVFAREQILMISEAFYHKPDELFQLVKKVISDYGISEMYIDTFPVGILGELNELNTDSCKIIYIARILNWRNYFPLIGIKNLRFEKTFIIEPLPDIQLEFVKNNSNSYSDINIDYPKKQITAYGSGILNSFKEPPWLIVHSESFEELELLYKHALEIAEMQDQKPEFLVISQTNNKLEGQNILQINYYPASEFFPYCEKIITACGFNSMYQTRKYAEKHYFIPFERRYDDQFERAYQRKLKI